MYESPPPSPDPPQFDDQPRVEPRRSRWLTALAWIAGGMATLVLVTSVGGYVLYRYYNGRIGHVQIVLQHPRPPAAPAGTQDFLLVGVDSRAGTGNEYQNTVDGVDPQVGFNSDTTILAHLDRDGTTTLLSFPRDMYVTIPSHKNSAGVTTPAHRAKINSAIAEGGPSLLVDTMQLLTHVAINHYVQVDLAGFKKLDDAVGGVDVCMKASSFQEVHREKGVIVGVSTNLNDGYTQFRGHPRLNHLNGDMALAFVRQRHGLPGGDIDRIKRQQVFLGALFRKALSTGVLLNPLRVQSLLGSLTSAITLGSGDVHTSVWDLARLSSRMKGLDPAKIRFETVTTREPTAADGAYQDSNRTWLMPGANGGSVQMYDQSTLDEQLAPLKDKPVDAPSATGSQASAKPLTVAPSQVSVTVLNGTRRSGLAGSTATSLTAQGFRVGPPADASNHDNAQTVIRFGAGQAEAARTLQTAIPGATVQADSSAGGTLVLVLGDDFTSVSAVHVGQAPSAAPSTSGPTSSPATPPPSVANAPANAAAAGTPCANPIY